MVFDTLNQEGTLLLECVSGSKAYGLDLPTSDTDIKGVFIQPKKSFFGLGEVLQANDEKNDIVFYEVGRFIDLLAKSNPNILEMVCVPEQFVLYKHPLMDLIKPELFISKACKNTFAGYAKTQIRKARGLNKKILNPVGKERKSVLDFCYVFYGQGSIGLKKWLELQGVEQENCGLVNVPHMKNMFSLFVDTADKAYGFKGVANLAKDANEVQLSSIPKGLEPAAYLFFSKDGYSKYCKDYKEYWAWVGKRNEVRYNNTVEHGKNYDAKNMMHTFRLLNMAKEIAVEGKINVHRPNREELLKVRAGEFMYNDLVKRAEVLVAEIEELFEKSTLPDFPDVVAAEGVLREIRERVYVS